MVDKILIKNRYADKLSTGAITQVFLNGKKLDGIKKVSYECEAGGIAIVKLEMYADIEIEANVKYHEIGQLEPVLQKTDNVELLSDEVISQEDEDWLKDKMDELKGL